MTTLFPSILPPEDDQDEDEDEDRTLNASDTTEDEGGDSHGRVTEIR